MAQTGQIVWKCDGCGIEITTDGPIPAGWLQCSYHYYVRSSATGVISVGDATGDFHAVDPCLNNFGMDMIADMAEEGVNPS